MDLNAGQKPAELRDHPRHQRNFQTVKEMRKAMQQNGVKSRVAESDLEPALGGRIALEHGFELLFDGAKHTASMDSDQKGRNMMLSRRFKRLLDGLLSRRAAGAGGSSLAIGLLARRSLRLRPPR